MWNQQHCHIVSPSRNRQEITRVCPGATTTCNGGTEPGIQKWEYSGVVTLSNCPDWIFGTRECCRNGAITTLVNPLSENMYIEATLDNSVSQNNSPVFSNIPIAFECIGQNNYYNHGGLDTDGDSLVYSFVAPLNDANLPVVWSGIRSTIRLLLFPEFDWSSKRRHFHASYNTWDCSNGRGNWWIQERCISGTVIRDLQIYTITCNNELPLMSGIDSTNIYTTQACLGSTVCFDVYSADLDTPDSLGISWNNGILQEHLLSTRVVVRPAILLDSPLQLMFVHSPGISQ